MGLFDGLLLDISPLFFLIEMTFVERGRSANRLLFLASLSENNVSFNDVPRLDQARCHGRLHPHNWLSLAGFFDLLVAGATSHSRL